MMMEVYARTPAHVRTLLVVPCKVPHPVAGLPPLPLGRSQGFDVGAEANAVTDFVQATFSEYLLVDV